MTDQPDTVALSREDMLLALSAVDERVTRLSMALRTLGANAPARTTTRAALTEMADLRERIWTALRPPTEEGEPSSDASNE